MKKKKISLIILFITCCFTTKLHSQSYWIFGDSLANNVISENNIKSDINFLTDSLCNGRETGTLGNTEAAFWLWRKFEKANLIPFNGSYSRRVIIDSSTIGHNIMGMLPGSNNGEIEDYIIVGTHFDHIGKLGKRYYPGADANASGVVAVSSIANIFANMKTFGKKYNSSIIFIGFDANLLSHAGSNELWNMIKNKKLIDPINGKAITKEKIKFMINIEQI